MAKGKKKKILKTLEIGFRLSDDIPETQPESKSKKEEKSSIVNIELTEHGKLPSDILERRFKERKIPKVDEGFKTSNKKEDLSYERLQQFYRDCRVDEYIKPVNGGKYVRFEFGQMLDGYRLYTDDSGENEIIRKLSYAEITKKSFINNLNLTIRYINYFITYFDDDDELMQAYFKLMLQLHLDKVEMPLESFVDAIYSIIATPSMVQKVIRMVEYNTDETLIKKSDNKFDESIQLTVEHLKAIMGISCFHRFIIPIVSHYYTIRRKEVEAAGLNDKELYFRVFQTFMPLFDKHYKISLYDKIYHTATTRISKTETNESLMWKRRERFGQTPTSFTNELMRDYLNDISQKVVFNQSAIIFLHVCFDKSIKNELIQPDKHEMSDMKMEPSDSVNETISRFDRWQMDRTQHSERDRLRAYASIKDMVWQLGAEQDLRFYKIPNKLNPGAISPDPEVQEEYEFYLKNAPKPLNDTQLYLIQLYCSKALGAAEDVKMMEYEDLIKMIMIMKRDLRSRNYNYIPLFISGILDPTKAKKYNRKRIEKLYTSVPMYEDWVEQFADTIEQFNMDKFYGELKSCISCPFSVVEYDGDSTGLGEYNGMTVTPSDYIIADEWCRFMCEI